MNTVEHLDVAELQEKDAQGEALLKGGLSLVKGVKVSLEVRIGEAIMTVDELLNLRVDSVVRLDRNAGSPVDLVLDDKVIARGKLVAADENFGLQITEICG
jgi:flagellar motor switch protein FliN